MTEFNPAEHNVEAVKQYIDENPQDAKAVLEAEQARGDDARSTLVSHLEGVVDAQHAAPEAVEPKAVEVSPAPTPTANTVLGKEYEVTPERGYRVKS